MKYNKDFLFRSEEAYELLMERKRQLEGVIKETEDRIVGAPKGKIHVILNGKQRKYDQYYLKREDKTQEYINRQEHEELIKRLIQKEYDEKILSAAKRENNALTRLFKSLKGEIITDVFDNLSEGRKKWIIPVVDSTETYLEKWKCDEAIPMNKYNNETEFFTKRGEKVRSKSEVIIANILEDYNIPYKYEAILSDDMGIWARPDFCVINVRKRKQYYWEHLGMLDSSQYACEVVRKIRNYRQHGIYEGEQLLTTMETASMPLSTKAVEELVKKYLI